MTEVGIMNELLFCANTDCQSCSRCNEGADCSKKLMRDARSVIKMQSEALQGIRETLDRLAKENAELVEKVKVSYTKEQLVEAVNDILDSFVNCEDYDDHTEAQLLAIGKFMKLTRLYGHIAVNCNADRFEIRLDK